MLVGEGVGVCMPHGVASALDEGFCCAPACVELLAPASSLPEQLQLFRAHEARCKRVEIPGLYPLDIHADICMVKCEAETIPGMRDVEMLVRALRLAMRAEAEYYFMGGAMAAPGQFLPQHSAYAGIVLPPGTGQLQFIIAEHPGETFRRRQV